MELHCYYEDIVYSNNGYIVLFCSTSHESAALVPQRNTYAQKGKYGFKALLNNIIMAEPFNKSKEYIFTGEWINSKYGLTFEVKNVEEYIGKNKADIIHFLTSIKGVGERSAIKIYKKFGDETIEILKTDIDRVLEAKVSKKIVLSIKNALTAKLYYKEVVDFLSQFSLSKAKIKAIYDKFGDLAINFIEENPFMVSDSGIISFIDANSIAVQLGTNLKSRIRIAQCIEYIISSVYKTRGHVFYDRRTIENRVVQFLNQNSSYGGRVSHSDVFNTTEEMIKSGALVLYRNVLYLKKDWFAEKQTANLMVDLLHCPYGNILSEGECLSAIKQAEKEFGFILNDIQKKAICCSMGSNISVITGGPGTGKTTLLKYILKIFQDRFGDNIGLCAPTGKAARRMAESTGVNNASTVHLLLGIDKEYGWSIENSNTIAVPYDLLVVDESSMLDMELAYLLMTSIPKTCKVIFLGDVDQLPSVGPGNVLKEMIDSEVIPVTKLNQIYRQAKDSYIIRNSFILNQGKTNFQTSSDFVVRNKKNNINEWLVHYYIKIINDKGYAPESVQILTPFRSERYDASTYKINKMIQEKINPPLNEKNDIKIGNIFFREGDRIVQQKNTAEIKNGDVGTILTIGLNKELGCTTVVIDFGDERIIEYDESQMRENKLDLAYALTVHKAQGMEYDVVLMPSISEHESMLTRKLVYTAWTRAKKNLLIVGDMEYMKKAANNTNEAVRNTLLAQRIKAREKQYIEKSLMRKKK